VTADDNFAVIEQTELYALDRGADRSRLALAIRMVKRGNGGCLGQPVALQDDAAEGRLESVEGLDRQGRSTRDAHPQRDAARGKAEYIVGTPSNTVTPSRAMISRARPGWKRSSKVTVDPDAIPALRQHVWPKE
jgi:hypothetical protein